MARSSSGISRLVDILTFVNMPIRRKFQLFALGVSFWFVVLAAVGLYETHDDAARAALLIALLIAHGLLILFTLSITRALTTPIGEIIGQIRLLTEGDIDELSRVQVGNADEIGELSARFNRLLDALHEVNSFKKVIEEDDSVADVFERLGLVFSSKGFERHRFLERSGGGKGLVTVVGDVDCDWCADEIHADATRCRAFKTGVIVSSDAYPEICKQFALPEHGHVCMPLMIGGRSAGVAQIIISEENQEKREELRSRIDILGKFIKEALPVLEAKRLTETLRESAMRDSLTGLYNRRYLEETHGQIVALAERREAKFCLLMCDIDHFKMVNDGYGHGAGDMVLKELAAVALAQLRTADILVRYGGEELLAVLHDTDGDRGAIIGERVRRAVEAQEFLAGGTIIKVTISLGVATYPTDATTLWQCVKLADTALYQAKELGRNRVVVYRVESPCADDVGSEKTEGGEPSGADLEEPVGEEGAGAPYSASA